MGDENNETFAERLKRIEQKNAQVGLDSPRQPLGDMPNPHRRRKSFINPNMVIGALALGGVAYVGAPVVTESIAALKTMNEQMSGIATLRNDALDRARNFSMAMDGNSTGEKTPEVVADPTTYDRQQQRLGYSFGTGYAASAAGDAIALEAIFANYAPVNSQSAPLPVNKIPTNEECTLRPVGDGEKLVNVNVRQARDAAPLQFADDAAILASLQWASKEALEAGDLLTDYPGNPNLVRVMNVMVTDTSAPLYLALHSLEPNIFWNLHVAPGVEIAHLALISIGSAGFSGDIGDARVEHVMAKKYNTRDFQNPYHFSDDPASMTCMTRPFRQPNETWQAWQGSANGNTIDGNLLLGQDKGFAAYEFWFNEQTQASSQDNLVEAVSASHVLVGPVPAAPIEAQVGDTWHFTSHDHILTGSPDAISDAYTQLTAVYAEAAGQGTALATIPSETAIKILPDNVTLAQVTGELPNILGQTLVPDTVPARVDLSHFNDARKIVFSERLTIQDLLAADEAMPPEEQYTLYAQLRGPARFADHCGRALVNIAQACGFISGSARTQGDGAVQLTMEFGFIPGYDMGTFAQSGSHEFKRVTFIEQSEDLTYSSPQEQVDFISRLQEVCDELRREFGNCVISEAKFEEERNDGSRALGRLEVYYSDNSFEQRKIEQMADRLYARTSP